MDDETNAYREALFNPDAKFPFGQTVMTPGAMKALTSEDVLSALKRHALGDWCDCCEADQAENELSLREGFRLFSVYQSATGVKFWVITEADRSVTTVLLPSEY